MASDDHQKSSSWMRCQTGPMETCKLQLVSLRFWRLSQNPTGLQQVEPMRSLCDCQWNQHLHISSFCRSFQQLFGDVWWCLVDLLFSGTVLKSTTAYPAHIVLSCLCTALSHLQGGSDQERLLSRSPTQQPVLSSGSLDQGSQMDVRNRQLSQVAYVHAKFST